LNKSTVLCVCQHVNTYVYIFTCMYTVRATATPKTPPSEIAQHHVCTTLSTDGFNFLVQNVGGCQSQCWGLNVRVPAVEMSVCVCACVRACGWVYVCVCVIEHEMASSREGSMRNENTSTLSKFGRSRRYRIRQQPAQLILRSFLRGGRSSLVDFNPVTIPISPPQTTPQH